MNMLIADDPFQCVVIDGVETGPQLMRTSPAYKNSTDKQLSLIHLQHLRQIKARLPYTFNVKDLDILCSYFQKNLIYQKL